MQVLLLSPLAPTAAAAALTASWRPLKDARDVSPPRSGPTAASDGINTWLFGGYAEPANGPRSVVNDLLLFEGRGWQQIQESTGAEKDDSRPGPRLAAASAVADGELLIFGGWDPQEAGTGGIILQDVWALNLDGRTWERCAASMPRGPTSRHVAVNIGGRVVVHTFRCQESVLVWDPEKRALREQPTSGSAPSPRGLHVAAAAGASTLVVFGGAAKDGTMLNDAYALDTRTWEWRMVEFDGGDLKPSPRAGACAASLPNSAGIVVCCGAEASESGLVPRADVWALTLAESEGGGRGALRGVWSQLIDDDDGSSLSAPRPGPRNAATLTPLGGGEFLLHGGWRPFVSTYGDSYLLKVDE
jgi:hypothetical protein